MAVLVCIPTNSVRGFPFLHTLSSIYCFSDFPTHGESGWFQLFPVLALFPLGSLQHCPRCGHRPEHTHGRLTNDCCMSKWTTEVRIFRVMLTYRKFSGVSGGETQSIPREHWSKHRGRWSQAPLWGRGARVLIHTLKIKTFYQKQTKNPTKTELTDTEIVGYRRWGGEWAKWWRRWKGTYLCKTWECNVQHSEFS